MTATRLKRKRNRWAVAVQAFLLAFAMAPAAPSAAVAVPAANGGPAVGLSAQQAAAGGSITVTGEDWRANSLLTMLICGQDAIGGTDSCANATGRAVTTDGSGAFSRRLRVADPPKPCPCVVHVATVLGAPESADASFVVAGHPVAPLRANTGGGLLTALAARLDGSSSLLTWFGAPPSRQLVVTVGNLASDPARNPVFQVGVSHGIYAPQWNDQQWQGTVRPGRKAEISLPVELAAGAHGDYRVTLKYAGTVLVEQAWSVSRPWGVTFFWILLFVVVPAAVFRIGMAVVDHVRPRRPGTVYGGSGRRRPVRAGTAAARTARTARTASANGTGLWPKAVEPALERLGRLRAPAKPMPRPPEPERYPAATSSYDPAALPWFAPDTLRSPRPHPRDAAPCAPSAPSANDRSTAKGGP